MSDLPHRLYRTKLTLLAVVLIGVGVLLMALADPDGRWAPVPFLPLTDLGSALFTTGVIGIALQYLDARDAEQRATERLRRVLSDSAPAIRDAVIDGFAFSPEALTSVTSPAVLQQIVRNCLALQLEDATMAAELHGELLEQAMQPGSRYSDSRLSVTIEPAPSTSPELLLVTLRREYRCRLIAPSLRFSFVSSAEDYAAQLRDPETTEVWRVAPDIDMGSAASVDGFAVLDVALDGQPQSLKRTARRGVTTYTSHLDVVAVDAMTHHLSYSYQVLVPRDRHSLFFDFGRPTQGLTFELDVAADAGIEIVQVLDFLGTPEEVRRARRTSDAGGGQYSVACDGWVLPKAGVVAVWR
jgi:hypothetical protein